MPFGHYIGQLIKADIDAQSAIWENAMPKQSDEEINLAEARIEIVLLVEDENDEGWSDADMYRRAREFCATYEVVHPDEVDESWSLVITSSGPGIPTYRHEYVGRGRIGAAS